MLPDIFERYRAPIEEVLRSVLADRTLPIYQIMRYHLGWVDAEGNPVGGISGKAFRPVLCLLGCEAVGGDWHKALPAAAAIELIHNFSLIHDDIEDADVERRHRPTVWYLWGAPSAITVGNAIRVVAKLALQRLSADGIGPEQSLQIWSAIEVNSLAMIEGQYLDLTFESRFDVSVDDYIRMISLKTGALIATSLKVGALLGTNDLKLIDGLENFGRKLGLVFQVTDDLLGIWGEPETTGKSTASDILRKKKSLPVVFAMQATQGFSHKELLETYKKPALDDDDLQRVLSILEETKARAFCEGMARHYAAAAVSALDELALSLWDRRELAGLCQFLLDRKF